MKKILFILFSGINIYSLAQQNLVPNPSFEDKFTCNDFNYYLETFIYNWYGGKGYYNVCRFSDFSVPANISGSQYPHTGDAFCGIYTGGLYSIPIRQYIQTKLNETLISEKKYKVAFYVSLGDAMHANCNSIGAYFSTDSFFVSQEGLIPLIPQIQNTNANDLSSKNNWTLVCDSFVATGNEKWITIGNFYDDLQSTLIPLDSVCSQPNPFNCASYFYIDDVSVTLIDETGLKTQKINNIILFPLPSNGSFRLQFDGNITQHLILYITDVYGKIIDNQEIMKNSTDYENPNLSNGLYFYSLKKGIDELVKGKIIISK